MKENLSLKDSKPTTRAVKDWLTDATIRLRQAGVASAQLDAELLLAHALKRDRSWLIAHSNDSVTIALANTLLARRLHREPLAYITGMKEFWGRPFIVAKDVLIPRPESEMLVAFAIHHVKTGPLIDIGTGSGCIGISIALDRPDIAVYAIDTSSAALAVAYKNAQLNQASITFMLGDLLTAYTGPRPECIVANLPYVNSQWHCSEETAFEPAEALFADNHGLELIFKLLDQALHELLPGGLLVLEADPRQFPAIRQAAFAKGFSLEIVEGYMMAFKAPSMMADRSQA